MGTTVKWVGEHGSVGEKGVDAADESKTLVAIDPAYFRPTEVDLLWGDCTKAQKVLGECRRRHCDLDYAFSTSGTIMGLRVLVARARSIF